MKKIIKVVLSILILGLFVSFSSIAERPFSEDLGGEYSNQYGTFTIGISHETLSGYYEYYDQYDKELHTYLRQNIFCIYGNSTDGKVFNIIAVPNSDPDSKVKGVVSFAGKTLKILLNKNVSIDAAFDTGGDGGQNVFRLKTSIPYVEVTVIKPKKAPLFNFDGGIFVIRKAYLLAGDIVAVLETKNHYKKIVYKAPGSIKTTTYWVKEADLYDTNPANRK